MTKTELLALHNETCTECEKIMRQKNADYTGGDDDPFSNFRIASIFGLHPVTGILLRVTDKLQRIRSFVTKGKLEVNGESVDDACDDIVNYAILIKGMLREEREAHVCTALPNMCAEKTNIVNCTSCNSLIENNHVYGYFCDKC